MEIRDFVQELATQKIFLWMENEAIKYKAPKEAMTVELIDSLKARKGELLAYFQKEGNFNFSKNTKDRYEKFGLTDIQNSYLMGRSTLYPLGGIACHGYIEIIFDKILNPHQLEVAWNKVIQKHDMLRAIVSNAGYQIIQEAVPYVTIAAIDLRKEKDKDKKENLRLQLSNKQYQTGEWPMCDLAVTLERETSTIHFSLDMLIADFVSMNIILNDLETFYKDPQTIIVPTTQYRDIIVYLEKQKMIASAKRSEAEQYWDKKLLQMGEAPQLPTRNDVDVSPIFFQKKFFLDNTLWGGFCKEAGKNRITPSTLILSALAEIVALWSGQNKFCINTTLLNRPKIVEDIDKIVGDFTDVNVTSIDLNFKKNFLSRAQILQENLWQDLEYSSVSGVEVLRKLTKHRQENIIIPVVFTSTLGVSSKSDTTCSKPIGHKLSQTPQVYIDCQVAGENNGVTVNWDIRKGMFDEEIIDSMFNSFKELMLKICEQPNNTFSAKFPVALPKSMTEVRNLVNATEKEIPATMLQDGFLTALQKSPHKTALITKEGEYTYENIFEYVKKIIYFLQKENIQEYYKIGIDIDKGVWQIASVLAVLLLDAVYVPIDVNQPITRKEKIIRAAKINMLISNSKDSKNLKDCKIIDINIVEQTELKKDILLSSFTEKDKNCDKEAYVIFTSGTSGEPKGVVITHKAAMNTIADINKKYNITQESVFLGLANLSFDLSVYDIFGCFAAAGTLVLPSSSETKNPKSIYDLIVVHKISIWNSVPAQMQMLISYIESITYNTQRMSLRVIFLSGDWIPVTLPKKTYNIFTNAKIVAMGGATEASIWSNFYNVSKNETFQISVPYGQPLANQKFYVLNEQMQPCPDYVKGNLYIAGEGLSLGYLNDEKQTREKYLILPQTQERVYKTGDQGYYRTDGLLVFCGREAGDEQVKINGHRVELAEVRSIIHEHPFVNSAAVFLSENKQHIYALISPLKEKYLHNVLVCEEEQSLLKDLGIYHEKNIDTEMFANWIKKLDEVVVADIFSTFVKYKVFDSAEKSYPFHTIAHALQVPEKLHKLLKRWLQVLLHENVILKNSKGYKRNQQINKELDGAKLWTEFYKIEKEFCYSKEFVNYLKKSSELLPQLIQGNENPLNILFPKGDLGPAMSAYHDNKINGVLNDITKKEISYLCKNKNHKESSEKTFRILEVGAGVGGTSIDVIPMLQDCKAEYYFTDLSTFFLNKAKENLGNYNWIKYGIFDINKNFISQGYTSFSFDLILCANVLHNSQNIHSVMENLKGLLKKEGTIIVLEETRTSYMLLTSMEFKDGLTGFIDERKENNQTFFTREQWEKIFEKHNGKIVYEFPAKESKLNLSGQTVYITRFAQEYKILEKEEIQNYLENTLPSYMLPSDTLIIPRMPLTENAKVDVKKIKTFFNNSTIKDNDKEKLELPTTDIEKAIEKIWCKELNLSSVGINENFYQLGGDSLIIAQVVGKMLEAIEEVQNWEWSMLLTEIMQSPTIREIAQKIEASQNEQGAPIDPCLIKVKKSKKKNYQSTAKVVFHAGAGTLTPYNNLLSYMEKDSKDNESILGFTFGNDAEYIAMPTDKTFQQLGQKYGKILQNLGYANYILVGHCVGGLIALESAKYLRANRLSVSDVTLISSGIPKKKNNTILSSVSDELYRKTLYSALDNELLLERIFAKLIDANEYKAGYTTNEERLQKYIEHISQKGTGDITIEALCDIENKEGFEDVAMEFRCQSSKSVSERLNALYNTIERPNGKLMEHQLKMLNVLFRIFSQNFRCVASYEPDIYLGAMRIFACEVQGGHFYPGFFEEDYETWKPYAQGNVHYDTISGQHFDCITEPNLEKNIKKILNFNYQVSDS